MKGNYFIIVIIFFLLNSAWAEETVRVINTIGDIRVRIGMEEEWQRAQMGAILKDLDTIFSGENSQVILLNQEGQRFTLDANSILDISDLRKIQERDLFLYLMTQKVDKLKIQEKSTKIRIGNVSVVHGNSKQEKAISESQEDNIDWYEFEMNGSNALFEHTYYPNAIIKWHRIKNRYTEEKDQGLTDFNIGRSFEAMDNDGQALDSYQAALETYTKYDTDNASEPDWIQKARLAIERLKEQQ